MKIIFYSLLAIIVGHFIGYNKVLISIGILVLVILSDMEYRIECIKDNIDSIIIK